MEINTVLMKTKGLVKKTNVICGRDNVTCAICGGKIVQDVVNQLVNSVNGSLPILSMDLQCIARILRDIRM